MSRGPGALQRAILAVLSPHEAMTTKQVAEELPGRWNTDVRQVRRALDSLLARGLVEQEWDVAGRTPGGGWWRPWDRYGAPTGYLGRAVWVLSPTGLSQTGAERPVDQG